MPEEGQAHPGKAHTRIPGRLSAVDADQLAQACAATLFENDHASRDLGMNIVAVSRDRVVLRMKVREEMLNGHGICHGGFVFALADSAFAFACNSHNVNTLAAGARIEFLAPARLHDQLTAVAELVQQGGRTGIYDVTVTNQKDERLALFRGNSYRIGGAIVDTLAGDTG